MNSISEGSYVLSKHTGSQPYHWVLRASNNEVILSSENYTTMQGAKNGIESCRVNSPIDSRYDRLVSKAGEPYFVLKASNGEVIGASEMYSSTQARENGIESVKRFGPDAKLIDNA